ncbi:MAG: NAD(+) synthase [Leptospiraceae bacterium]|nr:NAD(+) synthase [Leptospiraceae bacterium]
MQSKGPHHIRLATVSVNQTPLDWSGNRQRIQNALADLARRQGANQIDIVLFPELAISGYGCEDAFFYPQTLDRAMAAARQSAREADRLLPGALVFVGLPVRVHNEIYNCMAALHAGRIIGFNPKMHLANDGLHYEARQFRAWHGINTVNLDIDGRAVPIGPLLYDLDGRRIALEICRDAWYPDRPALLHAPAGLDLVLNPSASHFAMGKLRQRRQLALESGRTLGCHFVQVNLLGNEAGRVIFDGSSLFSSGGQMLAEDTGLGYGDYRVCVESLDLAANRAAQRRGAPQRFYPLLVAGPGVETNAGNNVASSLEIRLTSGQSGGIASVISTDPQVAPGSQVDQARLAATARDPWQINQSPGVSADERQDYLDFLRAASLGLFDYLRKSHTRGFALSLSGGADSACCALLVQRMTAIGIHDAGLQAFCHRIGRAEILETIDADLTRMMQLAPAAALQHNADPAHTAYRQALLQASRLVTGQLLCTVYQSTRQSSLTTREAARSVADALGARHSELEIDHLVDTYQSLASSALGRSLGWEQDNLTLQNIQARSRSPLVWMLANANNYLLIATGNRSEVSTGYCTMDGDTSGSLAPIGGVSKRFVLDFLRFMETEGDPLLGPVPELRYITAQAPTAELRPQSDGQTDEAELMPYPILEIIERMAVRDQQDDAAILAVLQTQPAAAACNPADLQAMIERFRRLWQRSQWKRERLAPAFHLDDYSLDPRGWCRYPILAGG